MARERKLRAIDATCPLVTKVHLEAIRFAKEGYTILLIGHEGHDEVIGTMGEAPEAIVLVESPEDVDRLEFPPTPKLAYLTQTTLSVDDANRIIARLQAALPADRRPAEGRHLLRHAEPPGGGSHAGRRGRRGAGAGQPEQLEQPAAGGARPRARHPGVPDRRRGRHRRRLVRRAPKRCSSPPAPALRNRSSRSASNYLCERFGATVEARTIRRKTCTSRCRGNCGRSARPDARRKSRLLPRVCLRETRRSRPLPPFSRGFAPCDYTLWEAAHACLCLASCTRLFPERRRALGRELPSRRLAAVPRPRANGRIGRDGFARRLAGWRTARSVAR